MSSAGESAHVRPIEKSAGASSASSACSLALDTEQQVLDCYWRMVETCKGYEQLDNMSDSFVAMLRNQGQNMRVIERVIKAWGLARSHAAGRTAFASAAASSSVSRTAPVALSQTTLCSARCAKHAARRPAPLVPVAPVVAARHAHERTCARVATRASSHKNEKH